MNSNVKKIAILGGSFNPPHLGHAEICKYVFNRGDVDQVWVVPCFEHPFGKKLASYEDRMAMCRFAFQEFGDKVWVSDVEKKLGGTSHTVKTIEHLKYQHPNIGFSLIMGGDISNEKAKWREFDRIKEMAMLIEVPRGKSSPIPDISSSDIRQKIATGERFNDLVSVPVAVYIVTHSLYHD